MIGVLALVVWMMSKPGPEALARLARVRAFGERAGKRLGPRMARLLGSGWLVALSVVGEGVELVAAEALKAPLPPVKPDAPAP